ncbi:hypothetical protein [Burkholderia pseudomultivorans]|uniref:hypothetical protein n=1 Tax=Burkholderia pseudomultivorans TaxID=1207504 RepID=UPI0012D8F021|nr:hypothetical protein [Burkholderia pseudomultivorans]
MDIVSKFWGGRFYEYDPIIRVANEWLATDPEWSIGILEVIFDQARRNSFNLDVDSVGIKDIARN